MTIAEKPIAAIRGHHRATGDGVHMVAQAFSQAFRQVTGKTPTAFSRS